jgi:DNA-binding response OmpR family regulator
MIAETDQFIAKLLVRFSEESGFETYLVKEEDDIFAQIYQTKPELIIFDVEYPGDMIGWEILRTLKTDSETNGIKLISCSWMNSSEVQSLTGNLSGYLQKPDITFQGFEDVLKSAGILKTTP